LGKFPDREPGYELRQEQQEAGRLTWTRGSYQEEETAQIVSGPNVTALHEQTLDVKSPAILNASETINET